MKKKILVLILFTSLLFIPKIASAIASNDKIHFIAVGESMIIESNGHYGLVDSINPSSIDSTANGTAVKTYAENIGINYFDFVIVTHSHYDHNGGIPELKSLFNNKTIVFYKEDLISYDSNGNVDDFEDTLHERIGGIPYDNHGYQNTAIAAFNEKNAIRCDVTKASLGNDSSCNLSSLHNDFISSVTYDSNSKFRYNTKVKENLKFTFGDFTINLYSLYNLSYHKENVNSIVTLITHNNSGAKAALPGDVETSVNDYSYGLQDYKSLNDDSKGLNNLNSTSYTANGTCDECTSLGVENQIADVIGEVDLLKSAHHGTNSANSTYSLDRYQPSYYITIGDLSYANVSGKGTVAYPNDASNNAAIYYLTKYNTKSYYANQADGALVAEFDNNSKNISIVNNTVSGSSSINTLKPLGEYYKNGWADINGRTLANDYMYVKDNEPVVSKWEYINSKWYHFNDIGIEDGVLSIEHNNAYCYCEKSTCTTGEFLNGWQKIGYDTYYYFRQSENNGSTGPINSMVVGWADIGGKTYYFNETGNYSDGTLGVMTTGFKTIGGKTYYFNEGEYAGSLVRNEWREINSKRYYIDENGEVRTGFYGKLYYLSPSSNPVGQMLTGWQTISGKTYYFRNSDNEISSGAKGTAVTGLATIDGQTYYFNDDVNSNDYGSLVKYDWVTIDSRTYYMDSSGHMVTGMLDIKGGIFYFSPISNPAGEMLTGWQTIEGNKYYFRQSNDEISSGTKGSAIVNSCVMIEGNQYCFNSNGVMGGQKLALDPPPVASYSGIFDGKYHTITVGEITGGTIKYSTDGINWSTKNPEIMSIGQTVVYVKAFGDSNHFDSDIVDAKITIIKDPEYTINGYQVVDVTISKISANTTVSDFKKNVTLNSGYTLDIDYKEIDGKKLVYTGGKMRVMNGATVHIEYTMVVPGDTNGDGKLNYLDYVNVYNHIQKEKHPESTKKLLIDNYFVAGDMSGDNNISYLDYVKIYQKIRELKGEN